MRFGTTRKTPARPVKGGGFAPKILQSVQQWTKQFDVPLLSLTPIDTIRQLALDPTQLTTIREAQALAGRTDSAKQALDQGFQQLNIKETIDSASALAQRLAATDPKKLGLEGTKQAIESVRETLREIDAAKKRVEQLERSTRAERAASGAGHAGAGSGAAEGLRVCQIAAEAPELCRARYRQRLLRPGEHRAFQAGALLGRAGAGVHAAGTGAAADLRPARLRAAGHTIEFPREKEFPRFLLEQGTLDFTIGGTSPLQGAYAATVRGVTSTPSLYGRPTVVSASRRAGSSTLGYIDVDAVINHVTAARWTPPGPPSRREAAVIRNSRGSFPGGSRHRHQQSRLHDEGWRGAALRALGDFVAAGSVDRRHGGRSLNEIERLVWRVVSGLSNLQVVAELSGSVGSPKLSVRSNLDQAIADRLQAVIGEEVAKAERLVRAKVDSLVADKVEPVKRQIAAVQAEATQRVQAERKRLDQVEQQLQAELKRLTAGLVPGLELPKIKL